MADNQQKLASFDTVSIEFYIGKWGAVVPMLFFVIWAIFMSLGLNGASETTRYLILGSIIGLVLGLFLTKSSWTGYCDSIFVGMSQSVGVVAIVCWLWAGMFAEVLKAGHLVEGLVWLGELLGVSSSLFVVVTFLASAIFASAVGTGYGTVIAFCTIMFPAGLVLGADPILMLGAILSGAAFGDNLAPVSDTTIVSAVTQETDVPGVVRSRFKYAITAGLPAAFLFLIFGQFMEPSSIVVPLKTPGPSGLILLIPFALVIFLALRGFHIIVSITWGILVASTMVVVFRLGTFADIFTLDVTNTQLAGGALIRGIVGYLDMAVLILLIVAAGYIMQAGGALDAIKNWILARVKKSVARAEVSMCSLVAILNVFITVNTAAEIAAAPFVKEVGKSFKIHPYRRANFLDAVTSAFGYIFPWSGGVLIGVKTLQDNFAGTLTIAHTEVWPYVFHGWLLVLVMYIAAITGFGRRYEAKDGSETIEPPVEN
ncbi:Na+/H+ antiporter NhaC family protein [candidate division KSB1 bacterium]|nr:Na+/H+ antiporter NhaC family protein [candidate division KSB1 bacterium]